MIDAPPAMMQKANQSSPAVARLRAPGWKDPRLLAGIVLVAVSVAVGSWLVASAGRTIPVYVADGTLIPGSVINESSMRVVDMRITSEMEHYITADEDLPAGVVANRVIADGELLTHAGVVAMAGKRSLAVPLSGGISERISPGKEVDLWFVPNAGFGRSVEHSQDEETSKNQPRIIASNVVVEQVQKGEGALVMASSTTVHVLVENAAVPDVLAALAEPGEIAVLPVGDELK